MLPGIGGEQLVPGRLLLLAARARVPAGVDLLRHFERAVVPAELVARQLDLVLAERRAVGLGRALLVRRTETDHGLAADQGRVGGLRARRLDRLAHLVGIMAVDVAHHLPAVGFEAGGGVVAEPAAHLAVDGDAVVVVEHDQLAQAEGAGQRAGLVRHALHQAAVAGEDVGVVVDHRQAVAVVLRRQQLLRQGHAHAHRQALAERPGGGLHARGVADLGMARGLGVELAEVLDLLQRQVVAGQVQQRVQQHRAVAVAEHEAVAVEPVRVGGVVVQVVVPQHLGDVRHAHGHARVTAVGLLDRVHGKGADGVGEFETGRHGGLAV